MLSIWPELEEALREEDWEAALQLMIEQWQRTPAPELAVLIEQVGARVDLELPRIAGNRHDLPGQWDALAETAGLVDLSRLFEALPRMTLRESELRLRKGRLADWPRDPRMTSLLVELMLHPELPRGEGSLGLWNTTCDRLVAMQDPRIVEKLQHFRERLRSLGGEVGNWSLSNRALQLVRQGTASYATLDEADLEVCRRLSRKFEASGTHRELIEDLERRVRTNPEDLEVRSVLGDALIEANDPRGEFIQIQLRALDKPGRDLRAREKDLLDRHRDAWLGGIRGAVQTSGLKFEGGFLAVAKARAVAWSWDFEQFIGRPEWATVRCLDVGAWCSTEVLDQVDRLLRHDQMTGLREVRGLFVAQLPRGRVLWTRLSLAGPLREQDVAALTACTTLPDLRHLDLGSLRQLPTDTALWRAPLLRQLHSLHLETQRPARWLPRARELPNLEELQMRGEYRLRLLGPGLTHLEYRWDWSFAHALSKGEEPAFLRILDACPQLRTISARPQPKTDAPEAVRACIRREVALRFPQAKLTLA